MNVEGRYRHVEDWTHKNEVDKEVGVGVRRPESSPESRRSFVKDSRPYQIDK